MAPAAATQLPDLWDDARAAGLDGPGLLLYRSTLLGADLRVTNFRGGNTSAKLDAVDPLTGESVKVLWVKGPGGDLGSVQRDGFATLYLDRLEGLKSLYRGGAHEDEMVEKLAHCAFNLNPRPASLDTPLHAFVPYAHVDHMHPDAVIAVAAAANSRALTQKIFGDAIGWLPWRRPGFDLGLKLGRLASENPHLEGVVLGGHGLFTWAHDARDCYRTTLRIINRAAEWLAANARTQAFGARAPSLPPEALQFVNSRDLDRLAPLGASRPDHFLRAKVRPPIAPADADQRATPTRSSISSPASA